MAHLACKTHGRRVVYINKKLIHRNGDGSVCMEGFRDIDLLATTNAVHNAMGRYNKGVEGVSEQFKMIKKTVQDAAKSVMTLVSASIVRRENAFNEYTYIHPVSAE